MGDPIDKKIEGTHLEGAESGCVSGVRPKNALLILNCTTFPIFHCRIVEGGTENIRVFIGWLLMACSFKAGSQVMELDDLQPWS